MSEAGVLACFLISFDEAAHQGELVLLLMSSAKNPYLIEKTAIQRLFKMIFSVQAPNIYSSIYLRVFVYFVR